jgi:hypothetical protein
MGHQTRGGDSLKRPINEREAEAERVYRQANARHPRAGRTARLYWEWMMLKVQLIAHQEKLTKQLKPEDAA